MTVVDTCCDLVKREFPSIDEDLFQYVKGKKKKNIHSVTEFALKFPINGLNIELQNFNLTNRKHGRSEVAAS